MKTLIIVESPSKAKKIETFLGKDYKVLSSKGHITDLAKGGSFNLGIDIANNFKPRYVLSEDKVDTLDQLLNAAEMCENILIASDPDREGEAIAWHLQDRLTDCGKPIKRIEFREITKKAVVEAIKKPRDINMNLFKSQEARRILDRVVGFMASPFLMNNIGPKLSAGRVQSVVVKMVIDREREIENFIPEEYWVLKSNLTDGTTVFSAKYDPKVTDGVTAEAARQALAGTNNDTKYVVTLVDSSEEKKKPVAPMVTSELQRVMSKSFGFAADRTMKAAQSLYENGYVTYIRSDSVRVEEDALKAVRQFISDNGYTLPKTANIHKNKDASQDAHECIRPTDLTVAANSPEFADPDEKKVYEIIWKYFVASQMEPAVYDTMKVTIQVKDSKKHFLKASGKALKNKGFLEILGITDDSKIDIPALTKGQELILTGKAPVSCEKKMTQAPGRYSEDTLIKMLVTKSIGRPATFAEILSKICSRNYVEKHGNVYHATDLGKTVTDSLAQFFSFMQYDYTSDMEQKLDLIEQGTTDSVKMLNEFYLPFKKELDKAYLNFGSTPCEKCESPMVSRVVQATGDKFLGCSNYPKCKNTRQIAVKNVA